MDRTCDPCRVKGSARQMTTCASLEKSEFWRAGVGAAEQENAPKLHPASCVSIQPVVKTTLSTCWRTVTLSGLRPLPHALSPERGLAERQVTARQHRERSREWPFCVLPSGRGVAQQMGECRRRTHQSDGAMSAPAPRTFRRYRNEQASRPIYPYGPRHGRLEVECGRSASGSPQQYGSGRRHHREPRG
jgi:hypothetical protein